MPRPTLALVVAVFAASLARGQAFSRTFDSGSSWDDLAWAGSSPRGDARLIGGSTDVLPGRFGDAVVVRLGADGSFASASAYGTTEREGASGAAPASDGGMLLCGATTFAFDFRTGFVARVDPSGRLAWSRTLLAPTPTQVTTAFAVTEIDGGRIAVAGAFSEIDAPPRYGFVVVLEADGTPTWQRFFGAGSFEEVKAIARAADGSLFVGGVSASPGGAGDADAWLVKMTPDGDVVWARAAGGAAADEIAAVAATPDGGCVAVGTTMSFTTSQRSPLVLRYDAGGTLLWHRVAGDAEWGDAQGVAVASDGSLLVLGRLDLGGGSIDLWLAKLKPDGTPVWQRAYDSGSGDWGRSVAEEPGGGIAVGAMSAWGFPEQDHWLLRLDSEGRLGCGIDREISIDLHEVRLERPPSSAQPHGETFTFPDAGFTEQALPITDASTCDACASAGGAPPREPSASPPWMRVFADPNEHVVVERVLEATAYDVHVGRIGDWYASSSASGTLCRVTSGNPVGREMISIDTIFPSGSWIAVAASNACGSSSVGRDSFGRERFASGTWESCPPGP